MDRILVIGASGQIGSDLTLELRKKFGNTNVYATDVRQAPDDIVEGGPFYILDVTDRESLIQFIKRFEITQIYHLAAMLSGNAEKQPLKAWEINMDSLIYVLNLAKDGLIKKVFWPSSIAVFGNSTPKVNTPQITITEPSTIYGISKLAGERWCDYYFNKYKVDVRSLRYPGLISYKTEAGGGTTDYAVEIFYDAIEKKKYECFLKEDMTLPMMFMPDAVKATIDLMEADLSKLSVHSSYNIGGVSFNPKELADEIKKSIPEFEISYKPDYRQEIAESWPQSINDSIAERDWGWKYEYGLAEMSEIMLKEIEKKLKS